MSLGWLLAFKTLQTLVMQFRDTRQRTDVFGVGGDGLPDGLHLGIMALESLVVILLTGRKLPVAHGHLFLKLPLARCQFLEDALNAIQPVVSAAVRHDQNSSISAYHRPKLAALCGTLKVSRSCCFSLIYPR